MTDIVATENITGIPIEKQNTPVPEIQEKKTSNLWEKVKEKLPFWKKEVNEKPAEVIEEISEITDEAGKIEDKSDKEDKLNVEGLPEGMEIVGAGRLADLEIKWLVESGRWNLKVNPDANENIFYLNISPKYPEGVTNAGNGLFVDARIAQVDSEGNVTVKPESGYKYSPQKEDFFSPEEGHIYRGLSGEELNTVISSGKIESRGDYVKDSGGHAGLTFFAKDPNHSLAYAESPAQLGYKSPSFESYNYLLSVKNPGGNTFTDNEGVDIAFDVPVPSENIDRVYEVRPLSIREGRAKLTKDHSGNLLVLNNNLIELADESPQFEYAIKDVTKDFFPNKA